MLAAHPNPNEKAPRTHARGAYRTANQRQLGTVR